MYKKKKLSNKLDIWGEFIDILLVFIFTNSAVHFIKFFLSLSPFVCAGLCVCAYMCKSLFLIFKHGWKKEASRTRKKFA